ncbi:MAG: ExeM/NucH family extracellular endonuclease [Phenylobacterium sp.]|nr:ExeM/NucH family extracellular endonuclease [Phenylobacterium sp.]
MPSSNLFISEVIEGSSNNKAIEIYNGTGAPIDLAAAGYSIQMFFNGSASAGLTINLTGVIAPGDVFVLAQSSAAAAILAQADQTNGAGWFNGDDAIVLRQGTTIIDVVGQIGFDPGTEWGSGLISTADNTLRRKPTVTDGDTIGADVFDPGSQWEGFATDTFAGLGSHTVDGDGPATPVVTVQATDPAGTEAGPDTSIGFTFARTGDLSQALTITYSVAGSATAGADYTPVSTGTVTFGVNESTATVNFTVLDDLDSEPSETVQVTITDGATYDVGAQGSAQAVITSDEVAITKISQVQGSGAASPMAGQTVTIEAIVTGDFQNGDSDTARNLGGFFVQEEAVDSDGNPLTSEGLFIFGGATDVNPGDIVRVTGTVVEFNGLTELNATAIEVVQAGAVTDISTLTTDIVLPGNLEAYEGMMVRIPQTLVVTDQEDLERLGELKLYASEGDGLGGQVDEAPDGRPYTFTQTNEPSVAGFSAYNAAVAGRTIIYDDGLNGTWQGIQSPNGGAYSTATAVQGGDTITNLEGVLDYGFGAFRVRSVEDGQNTFVDTNPADPTPPAVGGSLTVASFNVLNFFVTLNDGSSMDNGQEPRGANTEAEFARQVDKLVKTLITLDADVLALVEIENDFSVPSDPSFLTGGPAVRAQLFLEAGNAIGFLVEMLNLELGDNVYSWVDPGPDHIGTDAIAVGFIYKNDVVGIAEGTTVAVDFDAVNDRPTVAVTFEELSSGAEFTAVANHFKSKGSGTGENADQNDGQARSNADRVQQAERLDAWLDTNPTGTDDGDYVLLGDFNAYYREDPIDVLRDAGYQVAFEETASSYVFDGLIGTLDYALVSDSLAGQVTGAGHWQINADEAPALDYNLNLDSAPAGYVRPAGWFDSTTPYRTSDHDVTLIGLALAAPTVAPVAVADVAMVSEDASVTIDVLANDTDGNAGDTRTLVSVSATAKGATVQIVDGKVVYTADPDVFDLLGPGQTTTDSLTYVMEDAAGLTSSATVTVTINGVANAPTQNGGAGADTLTGTAGDEVLNGGNGNDILTAGDGADTLSGGNGNDSLFGGAGIDSLSGGSGNDTIVGGAGDDALSGSRGNDLFVFDSDFGHDQISDFKPGEDDIQFGAGTFTSFADVLAHAVQVGQHVVITADDGDTLQLNNLQLSSLQPADFLFA